MLSETQAREVIGDAGDALGGPAIDEEDHEVVPHEQAVVETVVTPVEPVRLSIETVIETVTGEVRTEQIEVGGDVERG